MTQERTDVSALGVEVSGSLASGKELSDLGRRGFFAVKRALDVGVSGALIVVAAPLMVLIALAIKVESPGDPIFVQRRLGRHGQPFSMLKFRTMYVGSEAGGVYEAVADARVTRFGRFLRKTSIDELPQLVNVVMGDMSMVGPRPVLEYHPWYFGEYTEEQSRRFDVRPGVTGWAQVNGRKTLHWPERLKLDVEYVDRAGPVMDAKIFALTALKVIAMSDNVNTSKTAVKNTSEVADT